MKIVQELIVRQIGYSNFSEAVDVLGKTRVGKNTYSYTIRNKNGVTFYNVPGQPDIVDKAIMGFINGDRARPTLLGSGTKANVAESSFTVYSIVNIILTWDDNSTDEDGFILERKKGAGSYSTLADLPANTITYTDEEVLLDDTYYYRVKAYNSFGDSDYSNVVSTID